MKKCTETDKPQISILMAIYEPRMDWLREQLLSLNAQTYPNLRLYIRDDCSPTVSFEEIQSCVQDCISAFSYEIARNEKNLGSNGTFERLTREAEGEYFAYCDQDDVWLPEKLEVLQKELSSTDALLICSDVILIDAAGKTFADSITELRPRHVFHEGKGLAPLLIYRNFVIGCTMLIYREAAIGALPFSACMVHDHYLAFYCAVHGAIAVCSQHLVRYRIHKANQTNVLAKITDKESYIRLHMDPFCNRVQELSRRFSVPELQEAAKWAGARKDNVTRTKGCIRKLWRLRKINFTTTCFELIALRMPAPIFCILLKMIQHGKI